MIKRNQMRRFFYSRKIGQKSEEERPVDVIQTKRPYGLLTSCLWYVQKPTKRMDELSAVKLVSRWRRHWAVGALKRDLRFVLSHFSDTLSKAGPNGTLLIERSIQAICRLIRWAGSSPSGIPPTQSKGHFVHFALHRDLFLDVRRLVHDFASLRRLHRSSEAIEGDWCGNWILVWNYLDVVTQWTPYLSHGAEQAHAVLLDAARGVFSVRQATGPLRMSRECCGLYENKIVD